MASKIDQDEENTASSPNIIAPQETLTGAVPLLPIQRWFFDTNQPELHHFNQSFLLKIKQEISRAALETALGQLLQHHDVLRMHYKKSEQGWQQTYLPSYMGQHQLPLTVVDVSGLTAEQHKTPSPKSAKEPKPA